MLPPSGEKIATDARFVKEAIRRNGELFAQRNNKLNLRGQEITGLDESESVIKLFKSDEYVKPLYASLRNMLFMDLPTGGVPLSFSVEAAENIRKQLTTLTELQDSDWPIMVRGYVLQENHRDMFDRIKQDYMDIFPTVLDLRVGQYRDLGYKPFLDERFQDNLTFGIREEGVEGWVASEDISAGMMKVLVYLIELGLAPQGTVVLIDELENSLGINCLPDLAQRMLKDLDRLQFIATSHHPRVINEIPYRRWRLVTRNGPIVKVLDATSIPALETASSLEKFTQLINLREYEEGVA
jgi:predicted ATPase